jgi:hypothetical protein
MTDNEFFTKTVQQLGEPPLLWYQRLGHIHPESPAAVRILLEQREKALQAAAKSLINNGDVRLTENGFVGASQADGCDELELRLYPEFHRYAPYVVFDNALHEAIATRLSRRQARDFLICAAGHDVEGTERILVASEGLLSSSPPADEHTGREGDVPARRQFPVRPVGPLSRGT